jgi:hypothetical protein
MLKIMLHLLETVTFVKKKQQKQKSLILLFIADFISWNIFGYDSAELSQCCIKSALDEIDFYLSEDFKQLAIAASTTTTNNNHEKITFNDILLIEAFYQIPKPQRVILAFLINHLSR